MATKHPNDNIMKICLLGASFDTGNMGVSALAASTVQCIVKTFPDAEIFLLNYGESDGFFDLELATGTVHLELINTSFSKRIWRFNHYLWQFLLAVLYRLLAWRALRNKIVKKSKYLQAIVESDVCLDISAGDSFSDIYGLYVFLYVSSYKLLVLLLGKRLVLLPQTYGPFKRRTAKVVARYILKRAAVTYSRDRVGMEYVRDLLNRRHGHEKVRFAPDVAFVLQPDEPDHIDIGSLESLRTEYSTVVGLNISGLLLNGGHTRDNMFGLKADYRELVYSIIKLFLKNERSLVLLLPHVFHPPGNVESDSEACMQVYSAMDADQTCYRNVRFPRRFTDARLHWGPFPGHSRRWARV